MDANVPECPQMGGLIMLTSVRYDRVQAVTDLAGPVASIEVKVADN